MARKLTHGAAIGALLSFGAASVSGAETMGAALKAGYNSYGVPGLIDMPAAYGREDGELAFSVSHFRNQTRTSLTFQVSDRLSASFRYSFLYDIRATQTSRIFPYIFDRSFSLHYRFMDEGRYLPAMAVGINDLVETGIYGGEYVVAVEFHPEVTHLGA